MKDTSGINRMKRHRLAWGVVVMVLTQILGMLPALDFLPSLALKYISAGMGLLLVVTKGVEMYFQQAEPLEEDISPDPVEPANLPFKTGKLENTVSAPSGLSPGIGAEAQPKKETT